MKKLVLFLIISLFLNSFIYIFAQDEPLWENEVLNSIRDVKISPDGKYIAVATSNYSSSESSISIFNINGASLFPYHVTGTVWSIDISNGGEYTVIGHDKTVSLFDLSGNEKWNLNTDYVITNVAITPNGEYILASNFRRYYLFDNARNKLLDKGGPNGDIENIALSKESKMIVIGTSQPNKIYLISFSGETLREISTEKEMINAISISEDGRYIGVCTTEFSNVPGRSSIYRIRVYEGDTNQSSFQQPTDNSCSSISFTGDGHYIVVSTGSGIRLYNLQTKELIWPQQNGSSSILRISGMADISEDGKYIIAGMSYSGKNLFLYQVDSFTQYDKIEFNEQYEKIKEIINKNKLDYSVPEIVNLLNNIEHDILSNDYESAKIKLEELNELLEGDVDKDGLKMGEDPYPLISNFLINDVNNAIINNSSFDIGKPDYDIGKAKKAFEDILDNPDSNSDKNVIRLFNIKDIANDLDEDGISNSNDSYRYVNDSIIFTTRTIISGNEKYNPDKAKNKLNEALAKANYDPEESIRLLGEARKLALDVDDDGTPNAEEGVIERIIEKFTQWYNNSFLNKIITVLGSIASILMMAYAVISAFRLTNKRYD